MKIFSGSIKTDWPFLLAISLLVLSFVYIFSCSGDGPANIEDMIVSGGDNNKYHDNHTPTEEEEEPNQYFPAMPSRPSILPPVKNPWQDLILPPPPLPPQPVCVECGPTGQMHYQYETGTPVVDWCCGDSRQ